MLKKVLKRKRSRILYLDHVEGDGVLLFEQIVKMEAEGLALQGDGEAVAALDQGEECEVFAG